MRSWPFLLFAAAVVLHHALLVLDPQFWTKGLLMGSLLVAVLLVALLTRRGIVAGSRATWMFALLCLAIAFSGAGDVALGYSFELGVAAFAAAQVALIALFAGPARGRPFPWWAIPYGLVYSPVIALLWGHLGAQAALVAVYGLLLITMAVLSVAVNRTVAIGGFVFLIAESLLGIRLFVPEWLAWFPDPFQDVTIMLLYCAGQGLIAFGLIQRLEREPELAETRARRRAQLAAEEFAPGRRD